MERVSLNFADELAAFRTRTAAPGYEALILLGTRQAVTAALLIGALHDLIYRDGHTYLDAYCYECAVGELVNRYNLYRLDRIIVGTLELLPTQLPAGEIPRRTHQLRYWL